VVGFLSCEHNKAQQNKFLNRRTKKMGYEGSGGSTALSFEI